MADQCAANLRAISSEVESLREGIELTEGALVSDFLSTEERESAVAHCTS